jgi:hypothetical protein
MDQDRGLSSNSVHVWFDYVQGEACGYGCVDCVSTCEEYLKPS